MRRNGVEQQKQDGAGLAASRVRTTRSMVRHTSLPSTVPTRASSSEFDGHGQLLLQRSADDRRTKRQQAGAGVGNVSDGCECYILHLLATGWPVLTVFYRSHTIHQILHVHTPRIA